MDYIKKIREIDQYLRLNLTEKRYLHSIEVAKMASKIAFKLNENKLKSYLAGLSHDIAREINTSILKEEITKITFFSDEFYDLPVLFHGPVGAIILEKKFNITDKDVIESAMFHSMGYIHMGNIAKIVYVSDYISMDRAYITPAFRKEILNQDLNNMLITVLRKIKEHIIATGEVILPETDKLYNSLMEIKNEKET